MASEIGRRLKSMIFRRRRHSEASSNSLASSASHSGTDGVMPLQLALPTNIVDPGTSIPCGGGGGGGGEGGGGGGGGGKTNDGDGIFVSKGPLGQIQDQRHNQHRPRQETREDDDTATSTTMTGTAGGDVVLGEEVEVEVEDEVVHEAAGALAGAVGHVGVAEAPEDARVAPQARGLQKGDGALQQRLQRLQDRPCQLEPEGVPSTLEASTWTACAGRPSLEHPQDALHPPAQHHLQRQNRLDPMHLEPSSQQQHRAATNNLNDNASSLNNNSPPPPPPSLALAPIATKGLPSGKDLQRSSSPPPSLSLPPRPERAPSISTPIFPIIPVTPFIAGLCSGFDQAHRISNQHALPSLSPSSPPSPSSSSKKTTAHDGADACDGRPDESQSQHGSGPLRLSPSLASTLLQTSTWTTASAAASASASAAAAAAAVAAAATASSSAQPQSPAPATLAPAPSSPSVRSVLRTPASPSSSSSSSSSSPSSSSSSSPSASPAGPTAAAPRRQSLLSTRHATLIQSLLLPLADDNLRGTDALDPAVAAVAAVGSASSHQHQHQHLHSQSRSQSQPHSYSLPHSHIHARSSHSLPVSAPARGPDARMAASVRKIWVKRPHASPTLVTTSENDLVDDVRDMILRKYANSLGKTFDSPDLIIRICPRDGNKDRILSPEESIKDTMDSYFPDGQSVAEALVIDVPRRTPKASPRANHPAPTATVYYTEDGRPPESGEGYFPPVPGVPSPHLPVAIPNSGSGSMPHSIAVIGSGHLPPIPSPGGVRSRQHRDPRQDRPRMGRTHTSSPNTHTGMPTSGSSSAVNSHGVQHHRPRHSHSRTHSSSSEVTGIIPSATPMTKSPGPEMVPTRVSTPPPRSSSPRMGGGRFKKLKKNGDYAAPQPARINGSVPPISVLIVEDNPINLKLLEAFVKRLKVRWETATNGREAVKKWRAGGFHLVLMDIQLPVMNGLEATREIRRLERVNSIGVFSSSISDSVPEECEELTEQDRLQDPALFKSPVIIVALTASSLQSDRHQALASGCNDFLTKPVNFVWLERKVMEWGCMQALIDFDGWRRWKDYSKQAEEAEANKRAQTQAAKNKSKKNRSSLLLSS